MAKNAEKTGRKFANLAQITAKVRREKKIGSSWPNSFFGTFPAKQIEMRADMGSSYLSFLYM
jgi:hypothetical protein